MFAGAHESLVAAIEQLSSLKGSAYAVVRNTAVIGGRSPARRPVAGEHVKGFDAFLGEHYDVGDGATAIKGGRDAVIGWLARGLTDGLRYDGELPERARPVLSAELDRPGVPTTATNSGVRDVHPTGLCARRSARR